MSSERYSLNEKQVNKLIEAFETLEDGSKGAYERIGFSKATIAYLLADMGLPEFASRMEARLKRVVEETIRSY